MCARRGGRTRVFAFHATRPSVPCDGGDSQVGPKKQRQKGEAGKRSDVVRGQGRYEELKADICGDGLARSCFAACSANDLGMDTTGVDFDVSARRKEEERAVETLVLTPSPACSASGIVVLGPTWLTLLQVNRNPEEYKMIRSNIGELRSKVKETCQVGDGFPSKVILLTGSAGFIGHALALTLHERGDRVVGIDNFNDYYPVSLKKARDEDLVGHGVHTIRGDLNDKELMEELFTMCKFTHIVHLAAQAGVRYAKKNPQSYVRSNLAGFVTIMETIARQEKKPHLIYASSSSVYGLNVKVPFQESDDVSKPSSLYGATKRANELLAHSYSHLYGISVTGLRFFTVYGPWGRPDMALFTFVRSVLQGVPIRVFRGPGDTELVRDFTYIDDIVKGCVGAIDTAPPSVKPAAIRLYNLGNTHPVSVSDLVGFIEKHVQKKAIVNYVPLPALGDVLYTHANVTHAREDFGYMPSTSLNDGVKSFVDWYQSYYGADGTRLRPDEYHYKPM